MLGFDTPGKNQSLYWEEEDPSNEFVSPIVKDIPGFEGTLESLSKI